jgi:hypothetical protein
MRGSSVAGAENFRAWLTTRVDLRMLLWANFENLFNIFTYN